MISVKEVEKIHAILIGKFGGSHGIRDLGSLESALARPFQRFENEELYPSPILKAAALLESILINHPFIDGNKRTAYTIVRLFLLSNDLPSDIMFPAVIPESESRFIADSRHFFA